jgi:hypothetical protein
VLTAYRDHSVAEVAASLGRTDSYVRKLRGGWRPRRVDDDLWQRLVTLRNEIVHGGALSPTKGVREQAPPYDSRGTGRIPEGMDPVTWAAAQFDLLSRMAGDASSTLVNYRRSADFTPEELAAIGARVLEETAERERQDSLVPQKKQA